MPKSNYVRLGLVDYPDFVVAAVVDDDGASRSGLCHEASLCICGLSMTKESPGGMTPRAFIRRRAHGHMFRLFLDSGVEADARTL